jgi:hypothetical protein
VLTSYLGCDQLKQVTFVSIVYVRSSVPDLLFVPNEMFAEVEVHVEETQAGNCPLVVTP